MDQDLLRYMKKVVSGEFVYPSVIELHTTTECNQDCIWCIMREQRKKNGNLTHQELSSIAYQMYENPDMRYVFISCGGEPLMNDNLFLPFEYQGKYFANFFEMLYAFGIKIGISTNGELLTKLIETKSYQYLGELRISVDAGCEDEYKLLHRSKNNFQLKTLISNIEKYYRLSGKKVVLTYLVHELNKNSYFALAKMFKEPKAVDKILVKRLKDDTKFFVKADDLYVNDIFISFAKDKVYPKYDYSSSTNILIDAKGDIYPCCHAIDDGESCIGNINDDTLSNLLKKNYQRLQSYTCKHCSSLPLNLLFNKFKEIGGETYDIL